MTALREEPGWYGEGGGADGMYASRTVEADREGPDSALRCGQGE